MLSGLVAIAAISGAPARAAGDLLVAPTRVILDGKRGTQVILNNVGTEETTYRISLEIKRMGEDGRLEDIDPAATNDAEKAALSLVRYAPRRVTLPPNQPQSIRVGLNPADTLPDGEYRVHMLFRAIPKTNAVTDDAAGTELKIQLIPLYGITIPIIVRKGDLRATAALANARMSRDEDGPVLELDATRQGSRSVYGEFRVTKPGQATPIVVQKGIAIYPEIGKRKVDLQLSDEEAAAIRGNEVIIAYHDTPENGGGMIAELRTVVR
ncbi:MAG: molecular chaperone [Sphingomonadales bacterium]|nr:molecular chaperone [Sphingomonadales bacterium]MBK9004973.1 molecular chaperone [Sphingomonadales bacterium]MBK9267294.1 molecular chaperone [Sphingomonadales bacterium]MBP6434329.1 molecular chaperone [Sphingorhabdus sp.]